MPCTPLPLRRAALPALVCLALVLTGCSSDTVDDSGASTRSDAPERTGSKSEKAGSKNPVGAGRSGGSRSATAVPVRIGIPSLGIDSELMRLGLNPDGTVEVPPAEKGMTAGWYTGGAVPGEPGAAVVIGHNDTRFGKAVFHDLKKIGKGADIAIHNDRGAELHFRVTGTETVSKKAFPTEKVYGPTDARTLRLITCDGAFDDQGHPVDNLIVYANRS
ncbi:class F sortase [Streptomyces sp. NPDC059605]|uniref:class F sortase n=1 Tax=unclassified Streptomyces TaxID=2593676 RepID=UPI00368E9BAA